ncbi:acyl carrier protein [Bermanella marisrubri]|uniref:Acyl carrier protein n=1 Tax=Bermanella marisrubri TaxID=207949 RepID=Q1N692_9GAMM|nr:acyl carrier protein [Bermanella marisrubri]EAT13700.1 Acyl carrier protein (ACP) [Oceanobacter sp. RED65] [Bermanella marisrubri]QIZ84478.1 acyl carrier protein [Bermanella marisrubri]
MSDIYNQVVEVVVEQLGVEVDQVKMESHFIEDLGADSLDTVELLMALEEKFDCEIEEDKAEKLTTVKDIVEFVQSLETA